MRNSTLETACSPERSHDSESGSNSENDAIARKPNANHRQPIPMGLNNG